jgi:hypothetical protein
VVFTVKVALAVVVVLVRFTGDCTEHVGAGVLVVEIAHANVTDPVKPLVALTAMVAVAELPGLTLADVGLAASVTPGGVEVTFRLRVVLCVVWPETALTVTVYFPAVGMVTVKVEVTEPLPGVTEPGFSAQGFVPAPWVGVTAQERFTGSLNPFDGVIVIVEVADFPGATDDDGENAEAPMVKSGSKPVDCRNATPCITQAGPPVVF